MVKIASNSGNPDGVDGGSKGACSKKLSRARGLTVCLWFAYLRRTRQTRKPLGETI